MARNRRAWTRVSALLALLLSLAACSGAERPLGCVDTCSGASDCYAVCRCDGDDDGICRERCPASPVSELPEDWPAQRQSLEDELVELSNEARAQGGCCEADMCFGASRPLALSAELSRAARAHAHDMATRQYFAHESPEGLTPFDRMRAQGFHGCSMGENLAEGQMSGADVVTSWLASPDHCLNLLDPEFQRMGAGYADSAGERGPFWVQTLGD